MALMMTIMEVALAIGGPAGHSFMPMGSHDGPGTATQSHEHDTAKSDAREP